MLWVGIGVGAGDGTDVDVGAVGGGTTGGGALVCPPGTAVFVADEVGVQLQVSSGEDGGSLGVGGVEDSDSVDVGCSLGVGSSVPDAVEVGEGSVVEGAGSELDGGRVAGGLDGCFVGGGSVDESGVVEDGCVDEGPPDELAGRECSVGGRSWSDVSAGFDGSFSGPEFGGPGGELSNVVRDGGPDSGRGFGVPENCPVRRDACES